MAYSHLPCFQSVLLVSFYDAEDLDSNFGSILVCYMTLNKSLKYLSSSFIYKMLNLPILVTLVTVQSCFKKLRRDKVGKFVQL